MRVDKGRIIYDLIEPNRRQYSIPVYQRNYDWSKDQCLKLFEDIVNAYTNDRTHFMGSIVIASVKSKNKLIRYIIIDGQQRMTTLFILLKALFDLAERENDRERLSDWLLNSDRYDEISIDDTNKLKLKPIKSDNNQLLLLMNNQFEEIDKSSNIYRNYELFQGKIKERLEAGDYIRDICNGVEKLICAMITLDTEDNPQEVFESINSTGLPLSISDLIRNYVLMTDDNQEYLYEHYWIPIEKLVGKNKMSAFIVDYLNMKIEGTFKEKDAYEVFKKHFREQKYSNELMLKEMLKYSKYFYCFNHGDEIYSKIVNQHLKSLRDLKQTTIYVFLFKLFDDFHDGRFSMVELEKILNFFVSYSVRRLVCEVGSNTLRGLFKTLYARVFGQANAKEHYYDSIVCFFEQLTTKDAYPSDKEFSVALCENDLYHKSAACRFILLTLENYASKEILSNNNLTIEHIMPQNKNLSDEWKEMLGENWSDTRIKYLHTLGNLTLTGYNSELSDKSFDKKVKLLYDKNSKVTVLNEDIINCDKWNQTTIEHRANVLADKLLKIFAIEPPVTVISYRDKSYVEYSCDNPKDAKYKMPNYFVLQGEQIRVSDFSDILSSVIRILFDSDSSIIEEMAETNERDRFIMFSYNKKTFRSSKSLNDTGIYYNTNLSAPDKIYFVRTLLDTYGIDRSDFLYSAKYY